ncbi:hypothetical protein GCM10008024_07610 [Allgaiera indica]|uniref:Uncharacterized protein n=2 Tax=Allgaiera indica TaxID=765699 RepID=A0AAN4ZY64_9RHOB|nr:hypothetical protein [Allgaiera indica]GHD99597.1 hypothetical protein GCM10008024_07610 [Allgaiera indica]
MSQVAHSRGLRNVSLEALLALAPEALAVAKASPDNMRLVLSAVALTDMLAAQIFYADETKHREAFGLKPKQDDSVFREKLAERDDDFRILRDLAKAQKHVKLARSDSKGTRVIEGAHQMTGRSTGAWGTRAWNTGQMNGLTVAGYVVTLNNGSVRNVLNVVERAQEFLESCIKP